MDVLESKERFGANEFEFIQRRDCKTVENLHSEIQNKFGVVTRWKILG